MAIAKIPMRMPSPLKLRLSNCISPVKMNQIDNKSMPRFFVILIDMVRLLSLKKLRVFVRKHGQCTIINIIQARNMLIGTFSYEYIFLNHQDVNEIDNSRIMMRDSVDSPPFLKEG